MITDNVGNPYYETDDLIKLVYTGRLELWEKVKTLESIDTVLYNKYPESLDLPMLNTCTPGYASTVSVDSENQQHFLMPDEYKHIDVLDFCLNRCKHDYERDRVHMEYEKYVKHNMVDILLYTIYLMDVIVENNIVIGVGRGSSVSSYILYLIGVHKIDPIQYELDCNEFFKDEE